MLAGGLGPCGLGQRQLASYSSNSNGEGGKDRCERLDKRQGPFKDLKSQDKWQVPDVRGKVGRTHTAQP